MMSKLKTILIALTALLPLLSCTELDYPTFDQPFVYFDGAATVNVDATGKVLRTYNLKLSAKTQTEPVNLKLSYSVGDGLKEGVDFEILTSDRISFLAGIYSMPVRVQWLRHSLDEAKDNTLTISIESCDREDVIIGIPGPAGRGRSIKFVKFQ